MRRLDRTVTLLRSDEFDSVPDVWKKERYRPGYFCWIGAAVFSAGAGGRAGCAPAFCASAGGRAGSGAGVVGRSPPGLDSAGLFCVSGGEGCCSGRLAWAICAGLWA